MSNKYQQLLDQYWQQNTSEAARRELLDYLQQQEEEVKSLQEEEYNQHLQSPVKLLAEQRSKEILEKIHASIAITATPVRKKVFPIRSIARWTAAAMLVLAAGFGYRLIHQPAQTPALTNITTATNELLWKRNKGNKLMELQLEDGSVVSLQPGSSIRYYEPFRDGKRDISLLGNARFKVQADAGNPFTVYANDVATVALGTEFSVNTTSPGSHVQVKLFSGKVMVRTVSLSMKDVYLKPGQQFNIDTTKHQFAVTSFGDKQDVETAAINNNINSEHTRLAFDQQPLTSVLEQISKRYNVHFSYAAKALNRVQVTGEFLPGDSLDFVLSVLSAANHLQFTQQGDTITVRKMK
ncbi:FecR domain-containing protein [uncultured Chitinophaga sp.]|uniref:FecR domain-containing protein n=1 Tax=uncultured Chitinophaga sp. TaxID=339340 RepID=UPI0025F7C785|nr:FecR domain-containing protein [uncultured Chitinophaga sp.]